jgi:uncharacterized protein with NRDE domain
MCLLIFDWRVNGETAFSVAANRDERYDRPATPITILRGDSPRILGGRDELAGGTWLAVNDHGVVAGLTNRPGPGGRDASKRSRGELPLIVTRHSTAATGVTEFIHSVRPGDYNQASLLVADRESLFYLELRADDTLVSRELGPGLHVLENVPLDSVSPKVDAVRQDIAAATADGRSMWSAYLSVLASHRIPPISTDSMETGRDPATLASCVHTENYGTRSSTMIGVPADVRALPDMLVADGPPCTAPFVDVSALWTGDTFAPA